MHGDSFGLLFIVYEMGIKVVKLLCSLNVGFVHFSRSGCSCTKHWVVCCPSAMWLMYNVIWRCISLAGRKVYNMLIEKGITYMWRVTVAPDADACTFV